MAFKITKLPGAARTYFFAHEGKRVTPTYAGDDPPVLATRPVESVFIDPWLKVEEVSGAELEAWNVREAGRAKAAEKAAKAPKVEPETKVQTSADSPAPAKPATPKKKAEKPAKPATPKKGAKAK